MREIPWLFELVSAYWGLSPEQRAVLWAAALQARWSRVWSWRHVVVASDNARARHEDLLSDPRYCPGTILLLVEELVRERCLSRAQAVPLEERILHKVTHDGEWVGIAVRPPGALDLGYVIERYWR